MAGKPKSTNKSLPLRLYGGLAFAILIVLSVAAVSIISLQRVEEDNNLTYHSIDVLQKVRDVRHELMRMRSSRHSFWFTGDESLLQSYEKGKTMITTRIDELKKLVSDNPQQTFAVSRLDSSVSELLGFWSGNGNYLLNSRRENVGGNIVREEQLLSPLYVLFEQIKAEEQHLLSTRKQAVMRSHNTTRLVVIGGIILLLAVVLVLVNAVITTLKSRIRAGNRLRQSLEDTEKMNIVAAEKNWVLTGVAHITSSIQSVDGKSNLSKDIIESLVSYIEVPAGAIYLYDEETDTLKMTAAVAVSAAAGLSFKRGEGIVGTAAQKRDISIIRNIPQDYWRIESAMGITSGKGEVACMPLWVAENLKAVIELGSLNPFEEKQLHLLESVRNTIATSIHTRQSRVKINQLLEQVQEQQEAMISQQEELRQTNDELSRQTLELQSSEEELKTQEEELKQINAELTEKNAIVEHAREALAIKANELEATSRYKSEFLANMSHELRTPLNSVLILAKLLADNGGKNLTDKQIEYANIIHKSGTGLLQLINDILDLSKIEAGKVDLVVEEVNIDSIITDLSQLFTVVAAEKQIRYTVQKSDDLPQSIRTDVQRLEQILKNLLSNAFKFTPKEGSITVSFQPRHQFNSKRIGISVTDSGIGISPAKQQLIFEAFQQADGSTSRQYGGTGLGLSISKELTRILGGEMELVSEEGKGSTFTIIIPYELVLQETVAQTPETLTSTKPVVLGKVEEQNKVEDDRSNVTRGDHTILIIEDDPSFATILKDFAHNKGYKTIVALQGDEGLLYARRYMPEAIILDIQLPVIDGWSLLKMLKADDTLKNIPVHIISAFDDNRLHTSGALAYLKKPVDREGLEKTFSAIGSYLQEHLKKVLIISANHFNDDSLEHLFRQKHPETSFDHVFSIEEAKQKISNESYECVIADIDDNIQTGVQNLEKISEELHTRQIPLIIYLDTDISPADELQLKKVSDTIVRNSPSVNKRLNDELELFLFKIQSAETVKETRAPEPVSNKPVNDISLSGKTVLVVDDDMRNVFALSNLLEAQQMQIYTASDGKESLEVLKNQKGIDIVLMDIMMPEMDGYEAMQKIRHELKMQQLPIIALTAKAMKGDREKCIEAGASDYITKPIDTQKLLSVMRVWLSA